MSTWMWTIQLTALDGKKELQEKPLAKLVDDLRPKTEKWKVCRYIYHFWWFAVFPCFFFLLTHWPYPSPILPLSIVDIFVYSIMLLFRIRLLVTIQSRLSTGMLKRWAEWSPFFLIEKHKKKEHEVTQWKVHNPLYETNWQHLWSCLFVALARSNGMSIQQVHVIGRSIPLLNPGLTFWENIFALKPSEKN